MTFVQFLPHLIKGSKWLILKIFEAEREKRGPSFMKKLKLLYASKTTFSDKHLRVSIAYLFRIKIDDKYLLIKGRRIDQYQPVGGVYKYYSEDVRDFFNRLDVRDDKLMPIDDHSRDDLRVRVPGKHLIEFLNWFTSEKGRETDQQREFLEELVEPGFLSAAFSKITSRYLYTVWRPLTYSPYSEATELMVYQVYELRLTTPQEAELKALQQQNVKELRWVTEDQIKRLGDDQLAHPDPFRIGHHTCYLLSAVG
jgi:hypothetical protein